MHICQQRFPHQYSLILNTNKKSEINCSFNKVYLCVRSYYEIGIVKIGGVCSVNYSCSSNACLNSTCCKADVNVSSCASCNSNGDCNKLRLYNLVANNDVCGDHQIADYKSCEKASIDLGLGDTTASVITTTYYPPEVLLIIAAYTSMYMLYRPLNTAARIHVYA